MRPLEHHVKRWLKERGLPIAEGAAAASPEAAGAEAERLGGDVVVKALIAAGRRGKAGAVRLAQGRAAAESAARDLLGSDIAGLTVERVYVERRVDVANELYLSFAFDGLGPKVLASTAGGVDIEETFATDPGRIASRDIDPRRGFRAWEAIDLWERAGLEPRLLPPLAALSVRLYEAFRDGDALMLELNPVALDSAGAPWLVGTMAEIDDQAVYRQPEWRAIETAEPSGRQPNERERLVIEANRKFPGGAIRYDELDGDIGLMVAGGGAGLLQHDLIVAARGRPANHSDISPTPGPDKPAAVFEAIFANPRARSLLIGYNFLQMARCDMVIKGLLMAMERRGVDARRFPIVVRLFGPGEDEARALAASVPGITYLPHGTSLAAGVAAIVEATRRLQESGTSR